MANTAWIASVVCPLGEVVHTSDASIQFADPDLSLMRCFIHKEYIDLCSLKSLRILIVFAVPEQDSAAGNIRR